MTYLDCLMDRLMKEIATYLAFVEITREPVTTAVISPYGRS